MNSIERLFIELIRVSIGTHDKLSCLPSADEWRKLYRIAERQSMLGICFAGLQNLGADSGKGYERIGISRETYFQWLGMAFLIQQKNELLNQRCAELQKILTFEGFTTLVLKGQGNASLYGTLSSLRQPGDIDLWVKSPPKQVIQYAEIVGISDNPTYLHIGIKVFDDIPVELHWRPTLFRNPISNYRIQKWCKGFSFDSAKFINGYGFSIPSDDFNRIFNLTHLYRHFMFEGVGLRQILDFYFILMNTRSSNAEEELSFISRLGIHKFTAAIMWVMKELFNIAEEKMICAPNAGEGQFLLNEIIQMGNFGKGDLRYRRDNAQVRLLKKWAHLVLHYPSEVLWNPVWILCRKIKKY